MNACRAVIPFKLENPKSRLSSVLSSDERISLARLMLKNAVLRLKDAGIADIDILSKTSVCLSDIFSPDSVPDDVSLIIDDRDLNSAVNSYLEKQTLSGSTDPADSILILMTDIPLVTADIIRRICNAKSDICIAPGRGGGTNILMIGRPDIFRVKYHGQSFLNHKKEAEELGLTFETFDSFFAGADLDEPDDIVEILIHGNGPVCEFLSGIFKTDDTNGCLRARISERR